MAMSVDNFPGCCAISVIKYVGGAEGFAEYPDKNTFYEDILKKPLNNLVIITTVNSQKIARDWLKELGFSDYEHGWMHIHCMVNSEMKKNIKAYFEEENRKKMVAAIAPPFEGLIKSADILDILNRVDKVTAFNDFYKLSLFGHMVTSYDIDNVLRSRINRDDRILELRGKIYRYVTEHRNRFNNR